MPMALLGVLTTVLFGSGNNLGAPRARVPTETEVVDYLHAALSDFYDDADDARGAEADAVLARLLEIRRAHARKTAAARMAAAGVREVERLEEACCVCWNDPEDAGAGARLACGHALCMGCATRILASPRADAARCPMCRAGVWGTNADDPRGA